MFCINSLPREGARSAGGRGFAPPLDPLLGKEGKNHTVALRRAQGDNKNAWIPAFAGMTD